MSTVEPRSPPSPGRHAPAQPAIARVLFGLYLALFAVCAVAPRDRAVWFAENAPIVMAVAAIWGFARRFRFSTGAWLCMAVLPALHTVGGHYTFEHVPFDWVTEFCGFERNHYDRLAHFSVGFFAWPIAEFLLGRGLVTRGSIATQFALFAIMAVAAGYEVFEWAYAVLGDPEAGAAVLGSQGDIWDAQKDILADTLGALFALGLFTLRRREPREP